MYIFLTILMSYILGSIPTALIIGKVFFKKDIRQYGSGNLGGSNTGRVLGKKVGLLVMILDMIKAIMAITITKLIINNTNPDLLNLSVYLSGTFALIGHCYTCFAKFKGGKAVASAFGILFITNIYIFLICLVLYVIILKLCKFVSLTSIIIFFIAAALSLIPIFKESPLLNMNFDIYYSLTLFLIACFVVYRHRSNIKRIKAGTENKITWMK
jgi:glycerol-3-phosphate acyltransferase PlsY